MCTCQIHGWNYQISMKLVTSMVKHKSYFYFLCNSMKLINYLWLGNLKQQKTWAILETPNSTILWREPHSHTPQAFYFFYYCCLKLLSFILPQLFMLYSISRTAVTNHHERGCLKRTLQQFWKSEAKVPAVTQAPGILDTLPMCWPPGSVAQRPPTQWASSPGEWQAEVKGGGVSKR